MEHHLDIHYTDFPLARPLMGIVTGIFEKDHQENWSGGAITLYQVTTRQYWPCTEEVLQPCFVLGQLFGLTDGKDNYEDTLTVGTPVMVAFWEFDHNRPVIIDRAPTWDIQAPAATADEMPVTRFRRRNAETEIDKNGKMKLTLAEGQPLEIADNNGTVRSRWNEAGDHEVFDANGVLQAVFKADGTNEFGSGTLRALVDERVIAAINGLSWTIPALTVSGSATVPSATTGVVTSLTVAGNTTTKTKAG